MSRFGEDPPAREGYDECPTCGDSGITMCGSPCRQCEAGEDAAQDQAESRVRDDAEGDER